MAEPAKNAAHETARDDAEPSMEEILASIRRIIADDEEGEVRERADYTHPALHSNTNEAAGTRNGDEGLPSGFADALDAELDRADALRPDIARKAAAVRAEIGAAGKDATPDERLQRYSSLRDMAGDDSASAATDAPAGDETEAQDDVPAANAPQPPATYAAAVPVAIDEEAIARRVARNLVEEQSHRLDAMVSEMVLPMVRSYMAENLPSLVERLVRDEIERVARGRQPRD